MEPVKRLLGFKIVLVHASACGASNGFLQVLPSRSEAGYTLPFRKAKRCQSDDATS